MKRVLSILLLAGLMGFTACGVVKGNIEDSGSEIVAETSAVEQAQASGTPEGPADSEKESMDKEAAETLADKTGRVSSKASDAAKGADGQKEGKDSSFAEKKDEVVQQEPEEIPGIDMADINMLDEPVTMIVKSDVNIRKGPKSTYDIMGEADSGEELTVIGRYKTNGWYYIEFGDKKAFVSHRFLLKDKKEYDEYQAQLAEAAELAREQKKQAEAGQQADAQQSGQAQAPALAAVPQPAPAPAQQPASQQPAPAPEIAGTLFIGDSRCVQMKALVGQSSWICENSKGYEWMVSKALGQADRIIGKGTRVVVCLGVNDTENCDKYAATINQKAAEWAAKGAKTYFVSVNPVSENPYRTEEEVEYFNSKMPGLLSGVTWIDTHSTLVNNGYTLVDGLHYNDSTNINIYNMIISQLK